MGKRTIKRELLVMIALVGAHALLCWLGSLLPNVSPPLALLAAFVVVGFPAIACVFYHLGIRKGSILGTASKKSRNDVLRCANHQELW